METNKYVRFAEIWFQIDAVSSKNFYPRLDKIGLTRGQPKMLRFLGKNDGCRQKDIAERYYLRAASVSTILNVMERDGLIERKINPHSRRETLVFLTEKGRQKLVQVEEFYKTIEQEIFGTFDDEEFEVLMEKLEKVRSLMEQV